MLLDDALTTLMSITAPLGYGMVGFDRVRKPCPRWFSFGLASPYQCSSLSVLPTAQHIALLTDISVLQG
jgi:hypothetical protein